VTNRLTPTHMNELTATHCQHCQRVIKRRGLCKACYFTPDVREKFAPKKRTAPPGVLSIDPTDEPDTPTRAPIGSGWKLRVMEARARAGMGVFHPADNPTAFLMVSERFWRKVVRRWARGQLKQVEVKT